MIQFKYLSLFLFLILFISCAKEEVKDLNIKKKSQELEMVSAYNDAYQKLNSNENYQAAQKFLEAELLFPQSDWASKSALMASYAYYLQNFYVEALSNLNRYLKTYPNDKDLPYVHYLIAICHYEMIEDEKRDTEPLLKAKKKFIYILEKYPRSDFALDSKFKLNLIQDILASKEMYLGRHYQKKNKWIAAINRFKNVVKDYDQTIYIEEALHRLVEINYKIGLIDEAEKYANILGYNYLSSKWYKKSYKVFNKNYDLINKKKVKKNKINKKSVIEKFQILLD